MLQAILTPRATGVRFIGDYYDLQNLYVTIKRVTDRATRVNQEPHANLLLSFAYEIRKAYEGHRPTYQDTATSFTYCSFTYLLPSVLVITNVVRYQAAYTVLDETNHAFLLLLDASVKRALLEFDAKGGEALQQRVGRGIWIHEELLEPLLHNVNARFVRQKTGKTRFRNLPQLFDILASYTAEGKQLLAWLQAEAQRLDCPPVELEPPFPAKVAW